MADRTRTRKSTPERGRAAAAAVAPPRRPWPGWVVLSILAGAALVSYARGFDHPFIFDDIPTIQANPQVHDWRNLREVYAAEQGSPVAGRPLVTWTFALNYAISGLDPRGFRATNAGIHVLTAWLLFLIARRLLRSPRVPVRLSSHADGLAMAIALLWTVHPLNSEVVDYITQRTEGLMALFYLLVLYASLRAREPGRATRWQLAAVVAAACGMACKEPMATVVLMVILADRVFAYDSWSAQWRARGAFYGALAATWVVLLALYWSGPREMSGGFHSAHVSSWTYLLNQTSMVLQYLRLSLWPSGLVVAYGWTPPVRLADVWLPAVVVTLLFVMSVIAVIRWPLIGSLAIWFFVTLAPTSSFLPITAEVGAERRMYLPLMGIVALAVIAVFEILLRFLRQRPAGSIAIASAVIFGIATVSLSAATMTRTREYESEPRLIRTMNERWPSGFAHHAEGVELARAGRLEEALAEFRQAVATYPPARYDLGVALQKLGRFDEAIAALQQFVVEEPELAERGSAYTMLGRAFAGRGDAAHAVEAFRKALALPRPDRSAHGALADLYLARDRYADAIAEYRLHLASQPSDSGAWSSLGIALLVTGQSADGIGAMRRAVDVAPSDGRLRENLARALLDAGNVRDGAVEAERAVQLRPDSPAAHDLMGRALAASGRVDAARAEFQRALAIDPGFADARAHLRAIGG